MISTRNWGERGGKDLREERRKEKREALGGKGGKGSQQGKGGKDLKEERGGEDLREEMEKIWEKRTWESPTKKGWKRFRKEKGEALRRGKALGGKGGKGSQQ